MSTPTWKFRAMYEFVDRIGEGKAGMDLIVHVNEDGVKQGVGAVYPTARACIADVMKTQALRQALDKVRLRCGIRWGAVAMRSVPEPQGTGVFFRDRNHHWDPKGISVPMLWNLYNGRVHKGESIRVFPLSNWTELDIWPDTSRPRRYPDGAAVLCPRKRPGGQKRDGMLIMVDDDRMPLEPGEATGNEKGPAFRPAPLGCYPLTGGDRILGHHAARCYRRKHSGERIPSAQGRAYRAGDGGASMEEKKRQGLFSDDGLQPEMSIEQILAEHANKDLLRFYHLWLCGGRQIDPDRRLLFDARQVLPKTSYRTVQAR